MSGTNRGAQRSAQRTPQRPRLVIAHAGNRFDLDESKIPAGMTYEWKVKTVMGKEMVREQIMQEANGWVSVPPERHRELTGSLMAKGDFIERDGLVLKERPKEITDEAREIDTFAARFQVASQLQKLKLTGHRAGGKGIKKSYEPPPDAIPDD